jgi:putative ABC transport system permease protein
VNWWRRLRHRNDLERELDAELREHVERLVADYLAAGKPESEARRQARLDFGGLDQVKDVCRDARGLTLLEDAAHDARYAFRNLRKTPSFTAVTVLTLALGMGATTAIFSVVKAVLLQALPYPGADRLVRIIENVPAAESFTGAAMRLPSMNQDDFDWWRKNTRTLSHMAVTMPEARTITTADGTERLAGARVSPALFPMRGVQPLLGRWLYPDEERPNAFVVVLGAATWQRYFNADRAVVNRSLVLDGQPHTIVGVMPPAFGDEAFWAPFVVEPPRPGTVRVIGVTSRLPDGVSLEAAAAEANALGHQLRGVPPAPGGAPRFEVVREQDQLVAAVRPALRVLVAAVGVVLLIVCANVANLLLIRGAARQREIGVRRALGATRVRIVRQLLTECLVLSLAGGLAGAVLAYGGVHLVRTWGTIDIPDRFRAAFGPGGTTILPRIGEIAVDPGVLAFAFGLSLLAGVVFGLAPALRLSRGDHRQVIAASGLAAGSGITARNAAGHVLAATQLALATTLLVGAGLLLHSFVNLSTLHLGFDRRAQIFQLIAPGEYARSRKLAIALEITSRLRALPRVEAAGFTNLVPLEGGVNRTAFVPSAWPTNKETLADENRSYRRSVSPDYLRALGVRLIEGRWLEERDDAGKPLAILVNRAWAKRFSPGRSPVGTTADSVPPFLGGAARRESWQIVGVVDDVRLRMQDGLQRQPVDELPPTVFQDLRQVVGREAPGVLDRPSRIDLDFELGGTRGVPFGLRVSGEPLSLADLRSVVRQVDPAVAVDGVTTMGDVFSGVIGRQRLYAVLVSLFGVIAGFIAAIGIYGVLAYAMTQRTQEFGIRLALGAPRGAVQGLALRQGVLLVAAGIAVGLAGAVGLTRYLSGMLFGLTPLDPLTYAAVAIIFAVVAMLASYVPARRASRVDALIALRHE